MPHGSGAVVEMNAFELGPYSGNLVAAGFSLRSAMVRFQQAEACGYGDSADSPSYSGISTTWRRNDQKLAPVQHSAGPALLPVAVAAARILPAQCSRFRA